MGSVFPPDDLGFVLVTTSKFQAMLLSNVYTSSLEAELGLVINDTQVNSTDSITILGVIVDN